ncbi:hypothetical protein [Periweissella beninensis]|uniref:Uncharacterized protein n=1 Tax=Periweissella beninensis TaxID=504936 RepID=A0ABT0VJ80_9LACO|nr:hypothetical protein [Periweissella beninensis]MBM7544943.1 peroxiredoxin [Periweissella beninensis]MCM2437183.1 hypothetical protein [Periweissella beninensis]
MSDYFELLEKLRQQEIDEFVVEVNDFTAFHKIWQTYQYQNQIKGEAARGGKITYRRSL